MHLVRHASAVGQAWLDVAGFNLTLVDLQRFRAWPGCSGQRADDQTMDAHIKQLCRSQYKICILVRNSIVGSSPSYLQELCLLVVSVLGRQHLWSAGRNDLLVPQFRTVNYGFSISGPWLWNTLPHDIRQSVGNLNLFKNKLKTYFFNCNSVTSASADPRHDICHYVMCNRVLLLLQSVVYG